MIKYLAALGLLLAGTSGVTVAEVLIVADEFPAMELVAAKLKSEERITSKVISQTELPASLAPFDAVIVYIHKELSASAEAALIDYTKAGGKLVVLHHSISSAKRKNPHWFSFLEVALPESDVAAGGYKWIHPVTLDFVNLAPRHYIMTNRVNYPAQISYATTNAPVRNGGLPGFTLEESEVYLNHALTGPRTLLMGFKYVDAGTKTTYMQDTAGWIKPTGKGWIIYLSPGHSVKDFENPTFARIVLNAVVWKP
ncbi:MAG: ThuA domain-containing protein [Verrucomicrobia bacterium]|nr:ThuA domain-containing protein [Verrucomicrobiota bacterium]